MFGPSFSILLICHFYFINLARGISSNNVLAPTNRENCDTVSDLSSLTTSQRIGVIYQQNQNVSTPLHQNAIVSHSNTSSTTEGTFLHDGARVLASNTNQNINLCNVTVGDLCDMLDVVKEYDQFKKRIITINNSFLLDTIKFLNNLEQVKNKPSLESNNNRDSDKVRQNDSVSSTTRNNVPHRLETQNKKRKLSESRDGTTTNDNENSNKESQILPRVVIHDVEHCPNSIVNSLNTNKQKQSNLKYDSCTSSNLEGTGDSDDEEHDVHNRPNNLEQGRKKKASNVSKSLDNLKLCKDSSDYSEISDFDIGDDDESEFVLEEGNKKLVITAVGGPTQLTNFNSDICSDNIDTFLREMMKQLISDNLKAKKRDRQQSLEMYYSYWQPIEKNGAKIDIFPGTHQFYTEDLRVHKYNKVTIIVPCNCAIISATSLLRSESSSRLDMNKKVSTDCRLICQIRKSSPEKVGLLRQGKENKCTDRCKLLHNNEECDECNHNDVYGDKIIDIEKLFLNGAERFEKLLIGEILFGDLKNLGFTVIKAPKPTKRFQGAVMKFKEDYMGKSPSIGEQNCKMIFPSVFPENAKGLYHEDLHLKSHLDKVITKIVHPILDDHFTHHDVNFLYNEGEIPFTHKPSFGGIYKHLPEPKEGME